MDSCIWLNLFKGEGDPAKGVPYWKIAQDFIDKVLSLDCNEIVYSGFVLKEIKLRLGDEMLFNEKTALLKGDERFKFIEAGGEDYSFARKLETEFDFELSFYDCLHIALCKRLNLILVTRDTALIERARKFVPASKLETLLS